MARAASALSPTMRTIRPQRVLVERPAQSERQRDADQEQRVDLQRGADLRRCRSSSRAESTGSIGACGWMNGLPRKNAKPGAEQHQRDADRDVVDARQTCRSQPCSAPNRAPATPAASTPSQGEPVRYETA